MFCRSVKDSTPSTPASSKGQSRKSRAPIPASEPDSSENEGTPCSTTASLPFPPSGTRSSTQIQSPSDQLEKSDRISKEKQKFFRLSAIFADKKRAAQKKKIEAAKNAELDEKKCLNNKTPKTVNSDVNKNRIESIGKRVSSSRTRSEVEKVETSDSSKATKKRDSENKCVTRTSNVKSNKIKEKKPKVVPAPAKISKSKIISKALASKNKKVENKPVEKESSSAPSSDEEVNQKGNQENEADCDSSMDSSEECSSSSSDESSSLESDSDSSNHPSETKIPGSKLKPSSSLFVATTSTSMNTFGSIGGISDSKDSEIWGFAAAAAEAKNNNVFGKTDTAGNFISNGIKTESKIDSLSSQVDDKSSNSTSNSSSSSSDRLKPGFGQLRGLFDGLSHLFTTGENRSRTNTMPNYSLSRRKRPSEKQIEKEASKKVVVEVQEEKKPKLEPKSESSINPKPENAVGIASVVTKQSNITVPPKIPRRITPTTIYSDKVFRSRKFMEEQSPCTPMTPSNLVKTAVNSKRHELERRNFLKGEVPFGGLGYMGFSHSSLLEDVRMKKRNLIAEATQINHPLSVPQPSNNQPGKMGHRTHPISPVPFSPVPLSPHIHVHTLLSTSYILSHAARGLKHTPTFSGRS